MTGRMRVLRQWLVWVLAGVAAVAALVHGPTTARLNMGNALVVQAILNQDAAASERAERLLAGLSSPKTATKAQRSLACMAWHQGNHALARDHALRALAHDPADEQAHEWAGRAFWSLGQKEKARQIWQEAGLLQPRLEYLYWLGRSHFGRQRFEEGVAVFEQAIDLDPTGGQAYAQIAAYYWHLGQSERARPYLEQAARWLPQGAGTQLLALGQLSMLDGEYAMAEDYFCSAWAAEASRIPLRSCLWALWRNGHVDKGWQTMQAGAEHFPDEVQGTARDWGERLFEGGDYVQAAHFYRLACDLAGPKSVACARQAEAERLASFKNRH